MFDENILQLLIKIPEETAKTQSPTKTDALMELSDYSKPLTNVTGERKVSEPASLPVLKRNEILKETLTGSVGVPSTLRQQKEDNLFHPRKNELISELTNYQCNIAYTGK